MIKISKFYPKDIIALVVLIFSLVLISKGINAIVSGIVIMIVTYYFSKRVYEEKHDEELEGEMKPLRIELGNNESIILSRRKQYEVTGLSPSKRSPPNPADKFTGDFKGTVKTPDTKPWKPIPKSD